ncbi:MAG: transcriptional modulator of MazE [Devosia sp.]|uniref:type II toxin-antitoxin system PemK/MazF family toxin n=1 Tax=Devosia sp. TaxID=1871048 RepID=UPI002603ABE7|nr:type II toxin-antitoxin system PemK/MazF family toxin [Devosia sp.]MDB5585914.1 transcriptional modulator of MazE [Devosia sp.]
MTERGAIYTMASKGAYTGKPRPAIVLQNSSISLDSLIVVPLTTTAVDAPLIRVPISANAATGLKQMSFAMADKLTTVPKSNLDKAIGKLDDTNMLEVERALRLLLRL